ncbi:head maturation protease, ClpP-related [Zhihengliuella halotolerans]|uniref:ATP-dependent Clp protease proteolytic subunit n=1 Tax=Zhihengliuella halotolerans TaxID=370736 RepID=A0A4Q8AC78_9MICC|nr:head maturation protease, ClpP-related [Zhihengliuella halotolerans]RZU61748.1 ATP-dependent protease ClpP protease subunit [Zhihengliuella halotolerans]
MSTKTAPGPAAAAPRQWYRMETDTEKRSAEIFIYEQIGGWFGISAQEFARELAALDVDDIDLRVNSPGGSVYDGVAIMNAIRRHPANVTATVDGIAASAASFLIMAADEIVMGRGAELMIHDAWTIAMGNADELAKDVANLNRLSDSIAALYSERAGGTGEQWRTAMKAETWYSAAEAVEAGLADRVDGSVEADADASAFSDVVRFAHAGRREAPAPWMPAAAHARHLDPARIDALLGHLPGNDHQTPPVEPEATNQIAPKGHTDMPDLTTGIRNRLGINADAELTDEDILAALDEALDEVADPAPAATQTPQAPGTVVLDETQYAELTKNAKAGAEARARQQREDRAALVNAAVNDGRIPPSRRDHWDGLLAADPGAKDVLAKLAKGTVPLESAGYTGGVDQASDEDVLYSKFYKTTEEK